MLTYNIFTNKLNADYGINDRMIKNIKQIVFLVLLMFCQASFAKTCVDIFSSTTQYNSLFNEYNTLVPFSTRLSGFFEYIVRNNLIIGDIVFNDREEGVPIVGQVVGQEGGQFLVRLIEFNNFEGHIITIPFKPKNLRLTEEDAQVLDRLIRLFGPAGLKPAPAPIQKMN